MGFIDLFFDTNARLLEGGRFAVVLGELVFETSSRLESELASSTTSAEATSTFLLTVFLVSVHSIH